MLANLLLNLFKQATKLGTLLFLLIDVGVKNPISACRLYTFIPL